MTARGWWENWPKPWTYEQCRLRYVQGERISLRKLEETSGVHIKTLESICSREFWRQQRTDYHKKLAVYVDQKAAERVSENLSIELSEITQQNFNDYNEIIKLARRYFYVWNKHLDSIPDEAEMRRVLTEELNPGQMAKYALVVDQAIKGLRTAAGVQYEDINTAIAKVTSAGYEVSEKDAGTDSNTAKD